MPCFKAVFLFYSLLFTFYFGYSQSTEIKYLSGHGNSDMVKWDFYCTGGMNSGRWTQIGVPSCWELQGFGKYDYGFAKDSIRGKEKGMYKYEFTVSPSWRGKQINLVFEGVMTDAEVKINGQSAGAVHQGAFYAFKYDITSLLKYDAKNILEVTVAKHSANASVNEAERKADFWIFGGIFRPVFLEALPQTHIENVAIDAKADGSFTANVVTKGTPQKASVQLYTNSGVKFGSSLNAITDGTSNTILFKSKVSSPKLWNPESPNLYKAIFTIYKNGNAVHTVTQKFGFRTVELKQRDGIYVNGVKVKMKGVNRHSFRPETGRTMSKQNSIEDVLLMKDMNMNAVRMSHYPPDDHFLDVCDSLGLFVMDELAGWHGNYDTQTGTKLLKEMMVHDVNHPSIVIWSNGNEGGHNFDLDHLFTEYDIQKRPVVHPWQLFNGVETQHYREYNYGIGNYENGREIVMPTEFLHGQFDGGHGAGLEDYWEKMWHNPLSAGGFLWDFADQAVVRKDLHDSLDTDKHRAADGILGPHFEKEGSYYAIKEIWSPVYIETKEISNFNNAVSLSVENRYTYTNLKECKFSWTTRRFLSGSSYTPQDSLIAISILGDSGKIEAPNVMPSGKGVIKFILPLTSHNYDFDALYVTAKDASGREIFTWSFPLCKPDKFISQSRMYNVPVKIVQKDSIYQVTTGFLTLLFNNQNGLLLKAENNSKTIPIYNGPIIQEAVNNFKNFSYRFDSTNLIIESEFDRKSNYNTLQWTIYPSGLVKMRVRYFPSAYNTDFVGVNFSFPENQIKDIVYLGNGPYRVWKNRMKGNQFGTWYKEYNNTETGEAPWIYPEFKGYYSNLYWCNFNTKDNKHFTVYTETEDVFLRLFTPAWKTDQWHNYEPIFPSGDISFMQGISSIGTKTQRNETTGPMGMKNIFYDYEKDPSRALELVLYFDFTGK
jgi:hypothetical protein